MSSLTPSSGISSVSSITDLNNSAIIIYCWAWANSPTKILGYLFLPRPRSVPTWAVEPLPHFQTASHRGTASPGRGWRASDTPRPPAPAPPACRSGWRTAGAAGHPPGEHRYIGTSPTCILPAYPWTIIVLEEVLTWIFSSRLSMRVEEVRRAMLNKALVAFIEVCLSKAPWKIFFNLYGL